MENGMNNSRRKAIRAVIKECTGMKQQFHDLVESLGSLKFQFEDLKSQIEELKEEEEEYRENMPESLQQSEKASIADEAISNLESALEKIGELDEITIESELLDDLLSDLENAAG
jgi:predicted RNase H-like nuclease (RuvC/YqgF family)